MSAVILGVLRSWKLDFSAGWRHHRADSKEGSVVEVVVCSPLYVMLPKIVNSGQESMVSWRSRFGEFGGGGELKTVPQESAMTKSFESIPNSTTAIALLPPAHEPVLEA